MLQIWQLSEAIPEAPPLWDLRCVCTSDELTQQIAGCSHHNKGPKHSKRLSLASSCRYFKYVKDEMHKDFAEDTDNDAFPVRSCHPPL